MITEPINAQLIGLKKYNEFLDAKPKKFYVQGNSDVGWRGGVVTEWMNAFVKVKDEDKEFILPAANLCYLYQEE